MIPVWPEDLPPPERNGFSLERGDARRRTPVDAGPVRVSRRFSRVADRASLSFLLTAAERDGFESFFDGETRQGTLPFLMPDPTKDGWPLTDEAGQAITDETGAPVTIDAVWLVTFGDRLPTASPVGVDWRVGFDLAVLP